VAPGTLSLVAARAVQGVGGALLVPSSLAIISAAFPAEERGRAIGTWAGFSALTRLVACLSLPAYSQTKQISLAEAKKQANEISTRFNESWNRHDPDGIAKLFAPDAVFVLPTGEC
jgi:hypothetical protein